MIGPGAVFEIPSALAQIPQITAQPNPPDRENRWVVVVSNKGDCRDRYHPIVTVVVLSAQTEYQGRHDVLIRHPDGGVQRDSIAQTDLTQPVLKTELTDDRYRGDLMRDTLRQIRAKLGETLGVAGDEARSI